jgi:hypothetical protein
LWLEGAMGLSEFFNQYKDAFTSIGVIVTIGIFGLGLSQYWRAETWKQSEFIAKLYKEFSDDADCQRAMWMLDWHSRPIEFGTDAAPNTLDYLDTMLPSALRSHGDFVRFSTDEMKIRDTFDVFFGYIEQFERALQNKLVRAEQVYPYFAYWIDMLAGKRHMKPEVRKCVLEYIDGYGFRDVRRFLDRWRG